MAHALASYVPRLVQDRLATGRAFHGPEWTRQPAAVLLGDIRGSTALLERFSRAGPEGLETLTWSLNAYFSDFVAAVHGTGGDVLFIAGDAFLCYWPGTGAAQDAAARAAAAGLAAQTRLHGREAGLGQRFEMRIGIGVGELILAFVGGVSGRWQLIAAGSALQQAVDAERRAPPGRVLLSAPAHAALADRVEADAYTAGTAALHGLRVPPPPAPAAPPATVAEPVLRPFTPPAIIERSLPEAAEWLAEARQVSVMMADLRAPEIVDDASLAVTHACVRAFQELVERHDGTLKVDVDDKGIALLAVFGLPPMAHENNAERALQCACALDAALQGMAMGCGIGIATGRAICGSFGSDLRREYMLRGEVINLAARLMGSTASGPVCDAATRHAAGGRIDCEALPMATLKGFADPVPRFRPTARAARLVPAMRPPLGRESEQRALGQRLQAVTGAVVLIEAEAGLGKSTLLADLSRAAQALGIRVLAGAADAIDRTTPYLAWREVFRSLLGLPAGVTTADAQVTLRRRLDPRPELARLAPLFNAVLSMGIPDTPLTADMSGEVRADNTRALLSALLAEEAERGPLALVVDDAHWLDASSLRLLAEVVRAVPTLLVLIGSRPREAGTAPEHRLLDELPRLERVPLEGLSPAATRALIARQLGVAQVPDQLAETVHSRSAGNPFFSEELVRALATTGAVRVADGRCLVSDLSRIALPPNVEGAILSRLDQLPAEQRLCLKTAAVVGHGFAERVVQAIVPEGVERAQVPAHLEALAEHGLVSVEQVEPERLYRFRHVITRDVTYELMPARQRGPLHRATAAWLEARHHGDLGPLSALLAHHWEHAGEPARAVDHLDRAAAQALRGGTFREAVALYERLLVLHRSVQPQRDAHTVAIWTKGLGLAHYFTGELSTSRSLLERAVGELDRPIPSAGHSVLAQLLANAARQVATRRLPAALPGRPARRDRRLDEAVDCYKVLGQIYYLAGAPATQLTYLTLRGVNVGERSGPSEALACITSNMGIVTGMLGMKAAARRYAERAVRMAEQQGQYAASAYVWHIHAIQCAQDGDWEAARAASRRAMGLIQELGDFNLEAEACVVRATINLCEGNFAEAPAAWRRARELAERRDNPQILCWSLLDEVDTLLGAGRIEAAAAVLPRALAIPTAAADGSSTLDKLRAQAVTRLRQGRIREAVEAADAVVALVARQPPTGYHWVDFFASAVEVYLAALGAGSAYAENHRGPLLDRAASGTRRLARMARTFWNVKPRARLLSGLLLARQAQPGGARRAYWQARDTAARMNMPFERARAELELGLIGGDGVDSQALLGEAQDTFRALGAGYYSAQAAAAHHR